MHRLASSFAALSSFTAMALFTAMVLAPSVALAGACPICTTSADCVDPEGGEAFCVLHDSDVGCGSARQICCPGQGCSTLSGRPSCEAAGTCSVVDGTDAGTPGTDGGAGVDSGIAGPDAATDVDGGDVADAGTTTVDAGGATVSSSGCGCRIGARSGGTGALALAGLALAALVSRRR